MTIQRHSGLRALARTALWTAAARARENDRKDRLFEDGYAAALAGDEALDEFDRTVEANGTQTGDLQAICTRFFDEFLLNIARTNGIKQVVLVGAGLDVRAFRMPWPSETHVFELDQPDVFEYKEGKLGVVGASPVCTRHIIAADLTTLSVDIVRQAGFDPTRRSAWLLEGFLYFLPEPAVHSLLQAISALAIPDSWIGLDVVNRDMLTSPYTKYWIESMAAAGAPWLSSSDEPELLLKRYGWTATVTQPGEPGAQFGRTAYPLTPRSLSGIPRTLLVTAVRDPQSRRIKGE